MLLLLKSKDVLYQVSKKPAWYRINKNKGIDSKTYKKYFELYTETHAPIPFNSCQIEIENKNITIKFGSDTV